MPDHKRAEVIGRIVDVFAHRFVIETADTRILADLGPKGADAFALALGQEIVASGEMKPSELKVDRIALKGRPPIIISPKDKHAPASDPDAAVRSVAAAGLEPIGRPRRKPKHYEVLARRNGDLVECHVELTGHIRKEKPVSPDDEKWSGELGEAA